LLRFNRLLKDDRDQLLSIWNQHVKNTLDTGDPFKYALYKLIGRIEVDRKAVRWVISTMEDWMWYQLHMIREVAPGVGLSGGDPRSYSLKDLQAIITDKGPSHFITAATQHNPLVYFQNLLYTGQFEVVRVTTETI
jgi:nuclear pore complex protein Nup93